jgi:hypothetical protein
MADRKISDLTALTAPAAGDYLPIVDISEVAAASKNKRITIEELFRGTPDGTAAAPAIAPESDPNTGIYSSGADQLSIATNGTERLRIDSSGRLLVGTSSTASAGGSQYAKLQVKGNTFSDSGGGVISVLSGTTTPASGVSVGAVLFAGTTGNEFGRIDCIADAATGASDYPGRLVFSTTADGAASPTERMRITSDAYVRLASGTGGIQFNGDTAAANALDDYEEGTFTPTILQGITSPVYNAGNTRGTYRVIGRQVFFSLRVTLTGGTADANQLRVGGLPFNPALSIEFRVIHVGLFQTGASSTPVHAVGANSTAYMDIVDSSDRTIVTGNEATNVLDLQITGAFPI